MKHKVMIAAGAQCFEFDGTILEMDEESIILEAKHGDIYIERKYLVFIQYLNEKEEEVVPQEYQSTKPVKVDAAAKFINKQLKYDPVEERVTKAVEYSAVPPSQLPDEDDLEVMRNVASDKHMWRDTPITNAEDLQHAVKAAMENEEHDFSMGMGGGKYKNPAQTILGMKNANSKKDRSR